MGAALFAVQGGEYGTMDLFRQGARREALQATVDSLQRQVDSLRAYRASVETDPAVQERLAREQFGMIRRGELLYVMVDSGDGGGRTSAAAPQGGRRPAP